MCLCVDPTWLAQQAAYSISWLREADYRSPVSELSYFSSVRLQTETRNIAHFFFLFSFPSHLHPTTLTVKNNSPTPATRQSQCLLGQGCAVLVTCVGPQYSVDIFSNKIRLCTNMSPTFDWTLSSIWISFLLI